MRWGMFRQQTSHGMPCSKHVPEMDIPTTNRRMKHLTALSTIVILVAAAGHVRADAFEFDAWTSPPPPWSTVEPVRMELLFRNTGPVPVHVSLWMTGMTRLDGLVEDFSMTEAMQLRCEGPPAGWCVFAERKYSPRPELYFQCFATPEVLPGDELACSFDVVPYSGASGFRTATLTASPFAAAPDTTPPEYQPIERNVVFGYGARQVPAFGALALLVLVLAVLGVGAARLHRL